jgi:hypothetical protein
MKRDRDEPIDTNRRFDAENEAIDGPRGRCRDKRGRR